MCFIKVSVQPCFYYDSFIENPLCSTVLILNSVDPPVFLLLIASRWVCSPQRAVKWHFPNPMQDRSVGPSWRIDLHYRFPSLQMFITDSIVENNGAAFGFCGYLKFCRLHNDDLVLFSVQELVAHIGHDPLACATDQVCCGTSFPVLWILWPEFLLPSSFWLTSNSFVRWGLIFIKLVRNLNSVSFSFQIPWAQSRVKE